MILFKVPWTKIGWYDEDYHNSNSSDSEVIILHWTKIFREYRYYESPRILTSDNDKCPYLEPSNELSSKFSKCRITFDRRYLERSNALVFHSFDLMTRDSDVYHPYAQIEELSGALPDATGQSIKLRNKTRLAAWIVSSCDSYSKRENLVQALQKYIQVDVYGWCGQECPKEGDCYAHIANTYKFYLSFENSLCTDYITEKFFNAMKQNLVPVVYGGTHTEDYSSIAPKDSYIDARNFKTAKDLADYLLFLDKNDEAYLKYFQWKSKFKVVIGQGWCNICQKVFEQVRHPPQQRNYKWYKDLWKWWNSMSYDTSIEIDEAMQSSLVEGQSYNYKLGAPACQPAKDFGNDNGKPDFEPGFLNGRFLLISIVYLVSYNILQMNLFKVPWTQIGWYDEDFHNSNSSDSEVIILQWTKIFREYRYYESPRILTSDNDKCPYLEPSNEASSKFSKCRITFDRRYLERSNALVFHSFDLMTEDVPKKRSKEQLWVYLQQECPIYTKLNLQAYPNIFNWTMTYRRDSDVYHPYAQIEELSEALPVATGQSIQLRNKTRLAAWIVSSCDSYSRRENLVQNLQKYIPVDVFGWCGQECPKEGDCYAHIANKYKFYLSFENSLCTDYITEKFFNAMKQNLVPVVYGGTHTEDYSMIAPKDSYIDARNFKTAKDLADYLLFLDKNDEAYLKYFQWKTKFKVVIGQGWCNICQKVFKQVRLPPQQRNYKWYKDLWKWWNSMSYDTNIEMDEAMQSSLVEGQSYNFRLGPPACQSAKDFGNGNGKPDFEPGFLNGRIYGKVGQWARDLVF
ncbi:unnamed protein product [Orchesella dallaii]|uniref:Fucosyltransferase n=1 Tax=Orchesella dallaii TaxID=48710 RepID=A0ABP1Q5U0_9HEXA